MTTAGGSESSLPTEVDIDRLKRLQQHLERDDDPVEIVSSTEQRLTRLHSEQDGPAVLVKTKKPTLALTTQQSQTYTVREFKQTIGLALTTLAVICWTLHWFRGRRRPINRSTGSQATASTVAHTPQDTKTRQTTLTVETLTSSPIHAKKHDQDADSSESVPHLANSPKDLFQADLDVTIVRSETTTTSLSIQASPSSSTTVPGEKVQAARQIAQDVQVMQHLLQQQGLDANLAPQMAVSLLSSQQMLESQRQYQAHRLMVDAHQKQLDRQLSQRQHEELLEATQYDPQWKAKLSQKRDACWNAVGRLIWQVLAAHVVARLIIPVWYWYQQKTASALTAQSLLHSVVSNICDYCGSDVVQIDLENVYSSSWTSFSLNDIWPTMGLGVCYGYCIASLGLVAFVAISSHQLLRAFSAPTIVHHLVNVAAVLCFQGPEHWLRKLHPATVWWQSVQEDTNLIVLGLAMASLFVVVQYRFRQSCAILAKASTKQSQQQVSFPKRLEQCLDELDDLEWQVCLVRHAVVVMYCSRILFLEASTASAQ